MDWRTWLGFPRPREIGAGGTREQGWRWRAPEMGRRLGTFGRGAPRLDVPALANLQRTVGDLQARWETYQERHPYRTLFGNLVIGLTLGFVLGRWATRRLGRS